MAQAVEHHPMTATEPAPRPDAPIAVSLETGASEGRLGLVPVTQDANRLDLWGRLAVGGLVAVWLILIRFSLSMIVIYPMNFIPLLALILRAKRNGDIIDRSAIIRRFCLGFFLGPTILFTALLCAQAISTVVPQDHVDAAACVVLGVLVVVEEAVKFAMIRSTYQRCAMTAMETAMREVRAGLYTSASVASGYAIITSIFLNLLLTGGDPETAGLLVGLLITFWTLLLYIPIHVLTGVQFGVELGRSFILHGSQSSVWIAICLAVALRAAHFIGLYLIATASINTVVVVVLVFVYSSVIIGAFIVFVRRSIRLLPETYRQSMGFFELLI